MIHVGLPWWSSGKDSVLPMQGPGFDPWSGNQITNFTNFGIKHSSSRNKGITSTLEGRVAKLRKIKQPPLRIVNEERWKTKQSTLKSRVTSLHVISALAARSWSTPWPEFREDPSAKRRAECWTAKALITWVHSPKWWSSYCAERNKSWKLWFTDFAWSWTTPFTSDTQNQRLFHAD